MARRYGGYPGAVRFVNGVLRNIARRIKEIEFPSLFEDPIAHISLVYSHPDWLVRDWVTQFGIDDTIALCREDNKPAPNTVRTNQLKTTRVQLANRLRSNGLQTHETAYTPEGLHISGDFSYTSLPAFQDGLFQIQDESSMLAARALQPTPGARVLDTCSAPGGKTTHLAELMGNQGEILALDIHPHKLTLLDKNCRRLGIHIVKQQIGDATALPEDLREWADFILVDAPCSGLGVLRRRPDARWRKNPRQFSELVQLQAKILVNTARCLKKGGALVYSTCTINPAENLEQVRRFLTQHPAFILEDLTKYLPADLDTQNTMAKGYLEILPHRQGMDGFFISRMRKKG